MIINAQIQFQYKLYVYYNSEKHNRDLRSRIMYANKREFKTYGSKLNMEPKGYKINYKVSAILILTAATSTINKLDVVKIGLVNVIEFKIIVSSTFKFFHTF